jgi:hypothetical protein
MCLKRGGAKGCDVFGFDQQELDEQWYHHPM